LKEEEVEKTKKCTQRFDILFFSFAAFFVVVPIAIAWLTALVLFYFIFVDCFQEEVSHCCLLEL
jgi:hypothetical protein